MNDFHNGIENLAIESLQAPLPVQFLHVAIFLSGGRTVSDETLRLSSFQGQESTSELFDYQLELHANDADDGNRFDSRDSINAYQVSDFIGRPVTVGIEYPSDQARDATPDLFQQAIKGGSVTPKIALFNGIVSSFSYEISGVYRLGMKPAPSRTTLTNHYRIHSQKNIRTVISDILDEHRISYSMDGVSGSDNFAVARIQDWLQAGETDFDFIKRLMGKAHLYFFFTQNGDSHKVIFANRPAYPYVFADRRPLRYSYSGVDELGLGQSDVISQYSYSQNLRSTGVKGTFTRQQSAWELDAVSQFESFHASDPPDVGDLPFRQYKLYQYGCSRDEVRHFTDTTSATQSASSSQFGGASFCAHLRVGHQFSITGSVLTDSHPNPVRPSLENQAFVVTSVKHQASLDGTYSNEFSASGASDLITPYSIAETQQGAVLAKVVSKTGAPAPADWRYYLPTPFDPETSKLVDSQAQPTSLSAMGVYVRFSLEDEDSGPVWVKLSPSMQTVPEIGVTVLVTRAQDESELPEIQSIIQANGSMVIMPSTWTANTHVGSSYSTNYGDGKSIRYGRTSSVDLPKAIKIVSTSYDSGQYRDTSYSQGAGYSYTTADSVAASYQSNASELYGPYAGASDILNASESFGSSYNRQYAKVTSSFSNIGTSYNKSTITTSESISDITTSTNTSTIGTSTSTDTIGTQTSTSNIGTQNSTSTIGSTTSTTTIGEQTSTNITGISTTTSVTGIATNTQVTGVSTGVQATGVQTSLSATGISSSVSATGVAAQMGVTGVSASVNVTGVSEAVSVSGVSNNTSVAGVSASESLTGVSSNTSLSGVSTSTGINGVSTSMNISGVSTNINITGVSTSMTICGSNNTIDLIGPGFKFSNQAL